MGSERTCVSPSLGETPAGAEQRGCIPEQGELPPSLAVMTCVTSRPVGSTQDIGSSGTGQVRPDDFLPASYHLIVYI